MTHNNDDAFWDLSREYVKKTQKNQSMCTNSTSDIKTVDIVSDGAQEQNFPIPKKVSCKETYAFEYSPDNAFISKIKISTSNAQGNVFLPDSMFMRERSAMINKIGTECPYVSFFSFYPRYSQMTRNQFSYYLWWRENIRQENYIPTDQSYVKLYMTELICTQDGEDVYDAANKMCFLIIQKSNSDIRVSLLRDLATFCMLNKIPCPDSLPLDMMPIDLLEEAYQSFYLPLNSKTRYTYGDVALSYISLYNYKKSKFYNETYRSQYDKYIRGAVNELFRDDTSYKKILSSVSGIFSTRLYRSRLFASKPNFCSGNTDIYISYYPVNIIYGLVTDAVRYAENKLRELLHIRTRLAISELDRDIMLTLDAYFDREFDPRDIPSTKQEHTPRAQEVKREEYEKLYDLPISPLSLEKASMIEKSSWETTFKLTEAFSGEYGTCDAKDINTEVDIEDTAPTSTANDPLPESDESDLKASFGKLYTFISLCKSGDVSAQKEFAKGENMTLCELADIANERACDILGDIIIEENGNGYSVISDYSDLIV